MDRGLKIPGIEGSKYYWLRDQNTMDKWVKIACVRGRYTMGREVNIQLIEMSKYHG